MKDIVKKLLLLLLFSVKLFCQEEGLDIEARFGRGPQIVSEKSVLQIEGRYDLLKGRKFEILTYNTSISYGVLHQLGVRAVIPAVLHFRDEDVQLRSFGDVFLLLDWHFFRRDNYLMTWTNGFKLPTASKQISSFSSSQSLDYFSELQTFFLTEDWYAESDYLILLKIKERKGVRFGNVYGFSYALGPRYMIHGGSTKLLLLGRITGNHRRPVVIDGITSENSGGTLILFGPDIIWSNTFFVLRGLFQATIADRPFGIQANIHFRTLFSLKLLF